MVVIKQIPAGQDTTGAPGDILLCNRKGFASWCIRTGETIKLGRKARFSHAAIFVKPDGLVESLTRGVAETSLSVYRGVEYVHIATGLDAHDQAQAVNFALSCVGQKYGWLDDVGIGLRFLTPGRGLWFGMNGTQICSGLCAQAQCRGDKIFTLEPSSISPEELYNEYATFATRVSGVTSGQLSGLDRNSQLF
jgi:hypothetical protein